MGLPWIRLDTQFPTNPKVLQLLGENRPKVALVYVCGLAYSGAHGTDGYLPQAALPFIHGTKTDAKHLVSVGLWQAVPGGWEVPGWGEFQPSNDESKQRKQRAKEAALKRWRGVGDDA